MVTLLQRFFYERFSLFFGNMGAGVRLEMVIPEKDFCCRMYDTWIDIPFIIYFALVRC